MNDQTETLSNQVLGFSMAARQARGRVVRLDSVLDEILSAHKYPAPITHLLAEALVLAALIGGLAKGPGTQMTMQAQTEEGPVGLLVCDFRDGEMRGYVEYDSARLAELGANPTLFSLFGRGYLAITFDPPNAQRYQGIVPLEGDSLAEACQRYFVQSEQIPTLLKVAIKSDGAGCTAGGMLVQHFPEGEEGRERLHVKLDHPDWEHVAALASTISHDELIDENLSMEAIVWRLFHEEDEVRVWSGAELARGCRCSIEHYHEVISRFPQEDQDDMRDENGRILVDCAFCSKQFELQI